MCGHFGTRLWIGGAQDLFVVIAAKNNISFVFSYGIAITGTMRSNILSNRWPIDTIVEFLRLDDCFLAFRRLRLWYRVTNVDIIDTPSILAVQKSIISIFFRINFLSFYRLFE